MIYYFDNIGPIKSYYPDQIDSTKNLPGDFQTRFNCDGSYWFSSFEKQRSAAKQQGWLLPSAPATLV